MMLRRGPWPWRARLLPTPGTQGRAHPRPPMPQVSPSPGRGRRPENFAWGKFGGRESPAEGHALRFAGSSARLRGREDPPGKWSPGLRTRAGCPQPESPPGAQGGGDVRRRITSVKLGCRDREAAARGWGAAQIPREAVCRVQTAVWNKFSEPFCCRLDHRCRRGLRKR